MSLRGCLWSIVGVGLVVAGLAVLYLLAVTYLMVNY
jgi:hypothetical protein